MHDGTASTARHGWVRAAPKILLHDHLDGGVRPATILDLADRSAPEGFPFDDADDADDVAAYLQRGAQRQDLNLYLEMFAYTISVMRSEANLARVVREAIQDYRNDGIVYAEFRFAPSLLAHERFGLHQVVETTLGAIADEMGRPDAPAIRVGVILVAMRNRNESVPIVNLVERYRENGVVGFDIAGPEQGYPAAAHAQGFDLCRRLGIPYTIHAGEGAGVESIRDATETCRAQRIGHGVRIVEDRDGDDWGPLANRLRSAAIVLEVCPTSNVHTGIAHTIREHPIEMLRSNGFSVTVNTDNRTMSGVSLTTEWEHCIEAFGWDRAIMASLNRIALRGAFVDDETKAQIEADLLAPFYDDELLA